jgi:hypothetical protein
LFSVLKERVTKIVEELKYAVTPPASRCCPTPP